MSWKALGHPTSLGRAQVALHGLGEKPAMLWLRLEPTERGGAAAGEVGASVSVREEDPTSDENVKDADVMRWFVDEPAVACPGRHREPNCLKVAVVRCEKLDSGKVGFLTKALGAGSPDCSVTISCGDSSRTTRVEKKSVQPVFMEALELPFDPKKEHTYVHLSVEAHHHVTKPTSPAARSVGSGLKIFADIVQEHALRLHADLSTFGISLRAGRWARVGSASTTSRRDTTTTGARRRSGRRCSIRTTARGASRSPRSCATTRSAARGIPASSRRLSRYGRSPRDDAFGARRVVPRRFVRRRSSWEVPPPAAGRAGPVGGPRVLRGATGFALGNPVAQRGTGRRLPGPVAAGSAPPRFSRRGRLVGPVPLSRVREMISSRARARGRTPFSNPTPQKVMAPVSYRIYEVSTAGT